MADKRAKPKQTLLMPEGQVIFDTAGIELVPNTGEAIHLDAWNKHYGHASGGKPARGFAATIPDRT